MSEKDRGSGIGCIQHSPWVGDNYQRGINGQRIAIVGHSHWRDPEDSTDVDSDRYSLNVIGDVICGKRLAFFTSIRGYFGCPTNEFWDRVMFFNFLPECLVKGSDTATGNLLKLNGLNFVLRNLLPRRAPIKSSFLRKRVGCTFRNRSTKSESPSGKSFRASSRGAFTMQVSGAP